MRVCSFLGGIPPKNKNPNKPIMLKSFIEGVNKVGDKGVIVNTFHPMDTDVAVIQGFVHANSKQTPHLKLRRMIYENQMQRGKKCVIVDSNLFLAYDKNNSKTYLRYSFNGIFANTGEYCNAPEHVDPARWNQLKNDLGIEVKPWKKRQDGHILIACQRDGGWSMQGQNVLQWLERTVKMIRNEIDSPIVVRFHPGDKLRDTYPAKIKHLDVIPSMSKTLFDDLQNARAMVGHNSSPSIIAAIEGVPVFLTDAGRSQAKEIANTNFKNLSHPDDFDRGAWLEKLAMCHWKLDELKSGECWKHMRKFI